MAYVYHIEGYGPNGDPGQSGPPGSVGSAGKPGATNAPTVDAQVSYSGLTSPDWLEELLRQAEDDFAGERLALAQTTLQFIVRSAADEGGVS